MKFHDVKARIDQMVERYFEIQHCLNSNEGTDWTFGNEMSGLKSTYQIQVDGSVFACVHGQYFFSLFVSLITHLLTFFFVFRNTN